MLFIVDDALQFVTIFFLRNKSDAVKVVNWVTEAVKQMEKPLRKINTDNSLKFCLAEGERYCTSRGIIHQRTMAYIPQKNGIAERMNKTLFDLVRRTLASTHLPHGAWSSWQ